MKVFVNSSILSIFSIFSLTHVLQTKIEAVFFFRFRMEREHMMGMNIEVPPGKVEEEVICSQNFETLLEYSERQRVFKAKIDSERRLSKSRDKRRVKILKRMPKSRTFESLDSTSSASAAIDVRKMVEARADEIQMCEISVNSKPEKTAITQRLPVYMRRRAMSHNPKRVPDFARKNLSLEKLAQSKKFKYKDHKKTKLSRGNIFINRQSRFRWLESHLWHAKRFHMVEKWGYKLPNYCTDKILRALHRDVKIKCAVSDTSYYGWVELKGPQNELLKSLNRIVSTDIGLTFAAADYLAGLKEGNVIVFMPDFYPYGCIGPVSFMWMAVEKGIDLGKTKDEKLLVSIERVLWISFHPSMKYSLISALKKLVRKSQIEFKNLTGALNSIEMIGHDSLKFLKKCLKFSSTDLKYQEKFIMSKTKNQTIKVSKSFWWTKMYESKEMKNQIQNQSDNWNGLTEKDVSQGQIFGFLARDPRIAFRAEENLEVQHSESEKNTTEPAFPISHSFIWDSDVRDYVMTRKMSNSQVQSYLSNHLPLTPVDLFDEEARIPILVVRKSLPVAKCEDFGSNRTNTDYNTIWKLIIPRNWLMAFWLLLKRLRVRVFGLRERERFLRRAGFAGFPTDFVDASVGMFCSRQLSNELRLDVLRRPHGKRFHFEIYGIANPFNCAFEELFDEDDSFDRKHLEKFLEISKTYLKNEEVLNPVLNPVKGEPKTGSDEIGSQSRAGQKRKSLDSINQNAGAKKAKLDIEDEYYKKVSFFLIF